MNGPPKFSAGYDGEVVGLLLCEVDDAPVTGDQREVEYVGGRNEDAVLRGLRSHTEPELGPISRQSRR